MERTDLMSLIVVDKATLSRLLGCTVRGLNKMIQRGDLPKPFHIGRKSFWRRETLLTFLENREKRGAS